MDQPINQRLDWTPNLALQALPSVSAQEHRTGLRNLAAAVNIITAGHEGARAGLTATAVVSVTAEPPRLAVFVNKNVVAADIILRSGALCVNVLSGPQEAVAKAFAGMVEGVHGDERFRHGSWSTMVTHSPALDNALVNFDCRVVKVYDESTHHVFLCEVLATRGCIDEDALVYINGAFRQIPH
ncbi:flavin reductase family protein [Ralstonia flatus]|jgi:flavin reductase (NADH)/flavin reductase|uniref:4-hydroxyphenylacetate 3-monooxygenase reductase component n=1 Tax=Ralstonia flatus TaxID=3058601 RepID=A0ABN9KHN5_9RALS|nr:flavin reductase family protein [Ralstonia sp. LMG 32965]CAJ0896200.1 4-hydroxyphenylacetate 3-monooxygenase reductase component [Ralstonia sp. LMG 32965]